jgi:hypothetical protein
MHRNAIDCEVLTGTIYHLPFNFQRSQFPIIAAFAMTINKSQKQTFKKIAILLTQPVFNCTSTSQQVAFDHHSMV